MRIHKKSDRRISDEVADNVFEEVAEQFERFYQNHDPELLWQCIDTMQTRQLAEGAAPDLESLPRPS